MEVIEHYDFELKKGDYVKINPLKPSFNSVTKQVIGVIKSFGNPYVNVEGFCLSKVWIGYNLSGNIKIIKDVAIGWSKKGFSCLNNELHYLFGVLEKELSGKPIKIYKLDDKEKEKFKSYLIKSKMLKELKNENR